MKAYKRILSFFLAFAMIICLSVPAFAVGEPTSGFWQWIPGFTSGGKFEDGGGRGDEAATAYNDYTKKVKDKLGTTRIGSDGYLIPITPTFGATYGKYEGTPVNISADAGYSSFVTSSGGGSFWSELPLVGGIAAADFRFPSLGYASSYWDNHTDGGTISSVMMSYKSGNIYSIFPYPSQAQVSPDTILASFKTGVSLTRSNTGFCTVYTRAWLYFQPYEYDPNAFTSDIGGAPSRPSSLVGNLGYYGDDGKLIIAENAKLVDETNNKVYNPVTNTTSNVTSWNYDYSDRSYHLTLEGDKSSTVTYGDEYVTIKEGDTIYNIYYVTQGGGGTDPDPGACEHTYTDATTTAPTCTTPGLKTSTCSKCSKSTTAPIPALGHTWVVERTVQTTYDESGALVQKGYTIYKCSVCNEQYKDENGTGPPGGGGSGGDQEDGDSIWDKLGKLLGSAANIFITVLKATVGKVLDALTALVDMINEKIESVVNSILGLFDRIPPMFSGFTAFLVAVFPFLPQEFFDILILAAALAALAFIIRTIMGRGH